jgi:O-acetylserine/cysteine efflux transporter
MQVFFTIGLAMLAGDEKLAPHQLAAFALALAGMGVIAAHNGAGTTLTGLALTLMAALAWAISNRAARAAVKAEPGLNILAYVVWASLFALPPLYLAALWREGWPAMMAGVTRATPMTWLVVLWQSLGNTMFGYGVWAFLLSRYPAATIAPMSLLVPVFGFAASALWLGESLQDWKIAAAALVMAGLAVNLFWRRKAVPAVSGAR